MKKFTLAIAAMLLMGLGTTYAQTYDVTYQTVESFASDEWSVDIEYLANEETDYDCYHLYMSLVTLPLQQGKTYTKDDFQYIYVENGHYADRHNFTSVQVVFGANNAFSLSGTATDSDGESVYAITAHYGEVTALENSALIKKAGKTIENGKVVILANGKRYSAHGAEF